jgi:hypothetical protein
MYCQFCRCYSSTDADKNFEDCSLRGPVNNAASVLSKTDASSAESLRFKI